MKRKYKVGDLVECYFMQTAGKKKKVIGTIITVNDSFGRPSYTINNGVVEDFKARNILRVIK